MLTPHNDFLSNSQEISFYGGVNNHIGANGNSRTKYSGVVTDSIFPPISINSDIEISSDNDNIKQLSKYIGELNVDKNSSIEEANSQLNIRINSNFWGGSSVSSDEHLSRTEKEYLSNEKSILIQDMKDLTGSVDTKNLAKVSSTLSDAAQAGLTRKDARIFNNLSNELQKIVDSAKTFNNYSFKEGDKKDLEDKLSVNNTLSWLKSENGKAVCEELGINIENIENIEPDSDGNIVIDGKTIQLSNDKLSIIEKSDKDNTYETSTYTLDDKYKPTETEAIELETYEKYHTDSNFTNLHEKDPETGKNLHLPENAQISNRAMQGLVNESEEFSNKLEEITGKSINDLKFLDNHAYYVDDDGVEHQFYYDDKNDNFINANVTPNKEKGGFDVEVNIPKIISDVKQNEPIKIESEIKGLTRESKTKLTKEDKETLDNFIKNENDTVKRAFETASDEDKQEFLNILKENTEKHNHIGGCVHMNMKVSVYEIIENLRYPKWDPASGYKDSSLREAIEKAKNTLYLRLQGRTVSDNNIFF